MSMRYRDCNDSMHDYYNDMEFWDGSIVPDPDLEVWVDSHGNRFGVTEMSNEHVANVVKCLWRRRDEWGNESLFIAPFESELSRRKIVL